MKYIISESRYNKMVSDYLDGIKYTEYIDDREIFLGNCEATCVLNMFGRTILLRLSKFLNQRELRSLAKTQIFARE